MVDQPQPTDPEPVRQAESRNSAEPPGDDSAVDRRWSARLRDGDTSALGEAFAHHRSRLQRMIHFRMDAKLRSRLDAEDILQEAYLAADKRLDHFRQTAMPLYIWLRQIALQTLIDIHRRHIGAQMRDAGREVSLHARAPQATSVSLAAHLLGRLTSPSQAALRDERARQLEQALAAMEPIDQEVLALRHFEELANREVAEVLGIEPKTASIRYIRALARLKQILAETPGFGQSASPP